MAAYAAHRLVRAPHGVARVAPSALTREGAGRARITDALPKQVRVSYLGDAFLGDKRGLPGQIAVMTSNSASSVPTLATALGGRPARQAPCIGVMQARRAAGELRARDRLERRPLCFLVAPRLEPRPRRHAESRATSCWFVTPRRAPDVVHARLAGVAGRVKDRPAIAAVSARIYAGHAAASCAYRAVTSSESLDFTERVRSSARTSKSPARIASATWTATSRGSAFGTSSLATMSVSM